MFELTLLQAVVLAAVLVELGLYTAARKLGRDPWAYRALGIAAVVLGVPVAGWLGFSAATALFHGGWRAALEGSLLLYALGLSTWLAWRESKPF